MIEVLVAVLILSIGLLGMASLQSTSLQQTTEARNRSQAVFLAQDLLERARANRSNVGNYAVPEGKDPVCNTSFAIDNSNVSTNDKNEWKNSLACLLPQGNGSATVTGNRITVTVTWSARNGLQDGSAADLANAGEIEVEAEI